MAKVVRKTRVKRDKMIMPPWMSRNLGFLRSADTRKVFLFYLGRLYPPTDPQYVLVLKALTTIEAWFAGKYRDGGERYAEHLLCSALIQIIYLRCRDSVLIASILLHDIMEDFPDEWSFGRLHDEFGRRVAELIWWVSKPAPLPGQTKEDVERSYHTQLNAAPREAIMVKLPERLHNLMTLWHRDVANIRRKVSETRDFYLPLAERHTIMVWALEDQLRLLEKKYVK